MRDEAGRSESAWMKYCGNFKDSIGIEQHYKGREQAGLVGVMSPGGRGNIPVLFARGKGLAEAWENSLIALAARGGFVRTQYDDRNSAGLYISPPSVDATMSMIVEEPSSDPMIHKCFPGGLDTLEEYRLEIMKGIKDHWIRDPNNPDDKRWEYTYHERAFSYSVPGLEESIDQVAAMVENLSRSPITRRAQVVTWKPWEDINISDPACFQSLWGRILRLNPEFQFYSDETTGEPKLNLNMRFRSRDAYEAAFMNTFAFIHLAEEMARRISGSLGEEVTLGRLVDQSDSYHIYGRKFQDFGDVFVSWLGKRTFGERTWTREFALPIFEAARPQIEAKVREYDSRGQEKSD